MTLVFKNPDEELRKTLKKIREDKGPAKDVLTTCEKGCKSVHPGWCLFLQGKGMPSDDCDCECHEGLVIRWEPKK